MNWMYDWAMNSDRMDNADTVTHTSFLLICYITISSHVETLVKIAANMVNYFPKLLDLLRPCTITFLPSHSVMCFQALSNSLWLFSKLLLKGLFDKWKKKMILSLCVFYVVNAVWNTFSVLFVPLFHCKVSLRISKVLIKLKCILIIKRKQQELVTCPEISQIWFLWLCFFSLTFLLSSLLLILEKSPKLSLYTLAVMYRYRGAEASDK